MAWIVLVFALGLCYCYFSIIFNVFRDMYTKETGKMIEWKVKVVFLCQMVQFSKVNFKMESFTVMVYIAGLMDQNMKV